MRRNIAVEYLFNPIYALTCPRLWADRRVVSPASTVLAVELIQAIIESLAWRCWHKMALSVT